MTTEEFLQNEANKFVESVLENALIEKEVRHKFNFLGYEVEFISQYFEDEEKISFSTKILDRTANFWFFYEKFANDIEMRKIVSKQMQSNVADLIMNF